MQENVLVSLLIISGTFFFYLFIIIMEKLMAKWDN